MKVAKLIGAWEAAKTSVQVETEANAQRQQQGLPPRVTTLEVEGLKRIFEKAVHPLSPIMDPSDAFFERKIGEVEVRFEVDALTRV